MVDPLTVMRSINKYGKYLMILVLFLHFTGIGFAGSGYIITAMSDLCINARAILATGAMILIILAAAVYAVGQVVGAETRARASVWATAMITGAVIGIVIYLIVPNIISFLMKGVQAPDDPCSFTYA